jgi:site-specific DNA recombinase
VIAPVFLKNTMRIEAFFTLYFLALLVPGAHRTGAAPRDETRAHQGVTDLPRTALLQTSHHLKALRADQDRARDDWYTAQGLSIAAIMRRLNEQGVPTRKRLSRWERSTVWAMLRNPAYKGLACYGKTKLTQRQRITRPLRLRGGFASRDSAGHERPREEWIEIPVPALVTDTAFDLAQERLQENKRLSPRRTVEWSIVQSLVSCSKCGYGMCRSSTRSSARKIHYYRCLGSDAWRHLNGALCDNRPVRQDLLDQLVWNEILKLLEDPSLIEGKIERRLTAARNSNPNKRREESLQRDLTRTRKGMERLVTAYQETLLSLEDLRTRMPELRRREQTLQAELTSITEQTNDRANYLRLTETLTAFMTRMRSSAQTLDIAEPSVSYDFS